jgi:class 3 adenylate cyclase
MNEKIQVLESVAMFMQVPRALLEQVAKDLEEFSIPAGYPLIRQGDRADALYVLKSGRLQVHLGDIVVREMAGVAVIGEYALLLGEPRTASITSLDECTLYRLEAEVFRDKLLGNLEITLAILKTLASRIIKEGEKNQRLMQNILPYDIAEELRNKGKVEVKTYAKVSVLFTDFKGFTALTESMSPEALITELNDCFFNFDEIAASHGMEKIKTIGDAYMCAGGIPKANLTNPVDAVLTGLAMQGFIHRRLAEKKITGSQYWNCRLGISTGEVIAGIIGKHKFAYDIWSDTVNTASRMESSGEQGRVNISESTYLEVQDFFVCQHRGKVQAKGKGEIAMYFVEGILPELSVEGLGLEPNAAFAARLATLGQKVNASDRN